MKRKRRAPKRILGKYEIAMPKGWVEDAVKELEKYSRLKRVLQKLNLLSLFEPKCECHET